MVLKNFWKIILMIAARNIPIIRRRIDAKRLGRK
jgi:hypothetical protein